MDRAWINHASKLQFINPEPLLKDLHTLDMRLGRSSLPRKVRTLRTNQLKRSREAREAALFCYGIGQRMGRPVYLAQDESQDYDFVGRWIDGSGGRHYAPVQLKEVVPADLNPAASIAAAIRSLTKYADSGELTVAIHLNRAAQFNPDELHIPPLRIAALWVFASISADKSVWGLWGNLLEDRLGSIFKHPRHAAG